MNNEEDDTTYYNGYYYSYKRKYEKITDSEVIVHLLEKDPSKPNISLKRIEGSMAIAWIQQGINKIML